MRFSSIALENGIETFLLYISGIAFRFLRMFRVESFLYAVFRSADEKKTKSENIEPSLVEWMDDLLENLIWSTYVNNVIRF